MRITKAIVAATLFGIVTLLLLPSGVEAQTVTMEKYRHPKDGMDRLFNRLYLAGVKDGLITYNVVSSDNLFCMPGGLALATEQAEDIILRWAKKQTQNIDNMPIGVALLHGLRETFLCPN
jgi:hypothetical protein